MHPLLFQFPDWLPLVGGRGIHVYGILVAVGFMMGLWWVKREARRLGLNPDKFMDLFFYIVLWAIIGARLLYVFASVDEWWKDPLVFIRFWEGGLVFYGGFIAAIGVSIYYCWKHRLSFFQVADIFAPGIALGHAFGRIGCHFAGCCYGKENPHGGFFSVIFPDVAFGVAPAGIPLYPTQLLEAFGETCIFLFLVFFRKYKKFEGEIFLLYIILYPILRSILEIYRGDKIRGFLIEGVLSTSQFISLLWIIIAVVLWLFVLRKTREGQK